MARIVSTGSTLASPEFRNKKRKENQRKLIIWSSCILLFLIGFVLLSRINSLLIKEVRVTGARVITKDEISSNVLKTLSGHYLWLIPRANAALYSRSSVEENLVKEFPRFSSISLSLEDATTLGVSVVERTPFALYCPSAERLENASSCFFLDNEGFIFDEAPAFSGNVYFVHTSMPNIELPKGKQYMEAKNFQNLTQLIESIASLGFTPLALESREEDFTLFMPESLRIVWKAGDDLTRVYSNLESFLQSKDIREMPDFMKKVKLLDLRTENKVFYRFKEQDDARILE